MYRDCVNKGGIDLSKEVPREIDLNIFLTQALSKSLEVLLMVFPRSKYPHFNSTYLVRVLFSSGIAVLMDMVTSKNSITTITTAWVDVDR